MKIGDKTETGYIFDIQNDTIFECTLEDSGKFNWEDARDCLFETGWRLPTKDELNLMYENLHKNNIGGFADNNYWSSSENNAHNAWLQYFFNGYQYNYFKNDILYVRAVRTYKIDTQFESFKQAVKN